MRYIKVVDRRQRLLFPDTVEDYVDENNPVRFIDAFIDGLDLLELGFTHSTTYDTGRKPYNPANLLKLYIYGYLNRIRGTRGVEKVTGEMSLTALCYNIKRILNIVDVKELMANLQAVKDNFIFILLFVQKIVKKTNNSTFISIFSIQYE